MYRLACHDLITVPGAGPRSGICWLRLYEGPDDHVAVVTEVPGNPGWSVDNGVSRIIEHLEASFGVRTRGLSLFVIWPRGAPIPDAPLVNRVSLGPGGAQWRSASRSEIEQCVGAPLAALPDHDELHRRVLALGGGTVVEDWRPVFEALPVDALPPPFPFRCAHTARFRRLLEEITGGASPSDEQRLEAGRRFLASLTPGDLRACSYHQGDWKSVAEASVRIIEHLGPRDRSVYREAAQHADLPDPERCWLVSLFASPIDIGEDAYVNGQHRSCALRFSGAERAAVVTHYESVGEATDDWIYEGDG